MSVVRSAVIVDYGVCNVSGFYLFLHGAWAGFYEGTYLTRQIHSLFSNIRVPWLVFLP